MAKRKTTLTARVAKARRIGRVEPRAIPPEACIPPEARPSKFDTWTITRDSEAAYEEHQAKQEKASYTTAPSPVFDSLSLLAASLTAAESVLADVTLRLATVLDDRQNNSPERDREYIAPATCQLCHAINEADERVKAIVQSLLDLESRLQL